MRKIKNSKNQGIYFSHNDKLFNISRNGDDLYLKMPDGGGKNFKSLNEVKKFIDK